MAGSISVGERVTHYKFGVGLVKELVSQGLAEVRFGTACRYVELKNLKSLDREKREEHAKRERVRQEDLRRKDEEGEPCRWDALRQQSEAKRRELLVELRGKLSSVFLGADSFYQESCAALITEQEYEQEKLDFVKLWVATNNRSIENPRGCVPDTEQAAAVASVHGNIQVVARAGSGKTTTLVNRALFLLKHCGVPPSQMLILAFNRKAAAELRRRLLALLDERANADLDRRINEMQGRKRIASDETESSTVDAVAEHFNVALPHVMTFHALANAIVRPEEDLLHDGVDGDPQGLSHAFQAVVDDHLQIPEFKEEMRKLMLAHFREDWDRIVAGGYDQSKEELLRFRRALTRQSMRGEYVKSYGEKVIADFLFEHDIPYKYERNYWWDGTNYRPDFTIFKAAASGLIIEYFGLSGDADYDRMSEAKREYWNAKIDWTLIEFSPTDIASQGVDSFRTCLKDRLEHEGIPCVRLSEDEIWERIRRRAIDRFTAASVGFVGRCRKQSLSPSDLEKRIAAHSPQSCVEKRFLVLVHQLFVSYLDRLSAMGEEDFDGLMQRAAQAVRSGQTAFRRKSGCGDLAALRYICIDEFQDFSDLFHRLLCAIRERNPAVQLFCVGDDWQAINGFAGSDLRFFANFSEHIGPSRRLYIQTNYRSSSAIVTVGNTLMSDLGEPARAHKDSFGKVFVSDLNKFVPSLIEKERHQGDIITPAVCRLVSKALEEDMRVVMLCRQNKLPWFVNYHGRARGRHLEQYLDLVQSFFPNDLRERISISTVHKYKGLENPMVIVLDAVARSYPLVHPDWIFSQILGESPEKITQEERRLLYVALTRAIDTLVILTDGRSKSPFLEDIERNQLLRALSWDDYPPAQAKKGRLVVRVGNQAGREGTATFVIKDLLKAAGYQWQSTGWRSWAKSFPVEGFSIENVKTEGWAETADGVEVRVLDDTEALVARFVINAREWGCVVNTV